MSAKNPYDRTDVLRRDAFDEGYEAGYQAALDDAEEARDRLNAQREDAAERAAECNRERGTR